ncbi:hypothetical protein, partial [Peribacillus sp. N1]
ISLVYLSSLGCITVFSVAILRTLKEIHTILRAGKFHAIALSYNSELYQYTWLSVVFLYGGPHRHVAGSFDTSTEG